MRTPRTSATSSPRTACTPPTSTWKPLSSTLESSGSTVTKGTLSLAGDVEYAPTITKLALDKVAVQGVHLEYIHKPGTAQVEQARKDQTVKAAKQVADQPDIELRINRVEVH